MQPEAQEIITYCNVLFEHSNEDWHRWKVGRAVVRKGGRSPAKKWGDRRINEQRRDKDHDRGIS